jgi:hypothetical protein
MADVPRTPLYRNLAVAGVLLALGVLAGCGTMPGGKRWGEDATLLPGWKKTGTAAYNALTSPQFYVPAAGALLFTVGEADEHLSTWAMDHTPVFGSQNRADNASKDIASVNAFAYGVSVLATPGGSDPTGWAVSKTKGVLVQGAALWLSRTAVYELKDAVGRERPNKDNDESFPSATSERAAAFATLASRNIRTIDMPEGAKTASNIGLTATTALSAWGRVEAGAHYPTDVLTGIAMGYFVTAFVNDAFMGLDDGPGGTPVAMFDGDRFYLGYCVRF